MFSRIFDEMAKFAQDNFLCNKRSQSEEPSQIGTIAPPRKAAPVVSNSWFLVLVVNVRHQELLEEIREQRTILPEQCDALYHATQFLRMGNLAEFKQSSLNERKIEEFANSQFHPSEYDVHFVSIELNHAESGFEAGVSQIDRLDAFERLPEILKRVSVSPRLPSRAYRQTGVYK